MPVDRPYFYGVYRKSMAKRLKEDYYTPEWITRKLIGSLPYYITGKVLEPFVGEGNISRILNESKEIDLTTNDFNLNVQADYHEDWKTFMNLYSYKANSFCSSNTDSWQLLSFDWVFTNPPFSIAPDFVPIALEKAKKGVICLLRLSFLEPCRNRKDFLQFNPPTQIYVTKRINFDGNGKDQVTTAWMIWLKDQTLISHVKENGVQINVMNWE